MSLTPAATRAIEWLEQQIRDLASVRNATARDPVFRNWRQGTVTVLQRIWPGDQPRLERFRRIPFSPADTRADSRAIREAYSRGCQEAQRVLKDFIEDVRKHGVAAAAHDSAHESPDDFAAGIPTLQLGGTGPSNAPTPAPPSAPEPATASAPEPATASAPEPATASAPEPAAPDVVPASPKPTPRTNGARTSAGANGRSASRAGSRSNGQPKPTAVPAEPAASLEPVTPVTPGVPSSDVHGDMGDLPPQGYGESCPLPMKKNRRAKPLLRDLLDRAQESARAIVGPPREENPPEASPEPLVDRPSVVTSHRTTLRGTIDKVSLDSLISPEFRETTPESAVPSEPLETFATDETLPPLEATEPDAIAPEPVAEIVAMPEPIALVPAPSAPLEDPEFAMDTPPASPPAPSATATPAAVLRLVAPPPPHEVASAPAESQEGLPDAEVEAFAEAAEAFLHTSPVLGATAVPRPVAAPSVREERLFVHPDAIAIASIVDDLHTLGIPESRHPETRARLMDLAQRLETADLEWHLLRAAVWFAMEYPRLACRVVPVLLPRMDRAA